MKKIVIYFPILISILLIAPAFLIPFSPDKLSSFYYRELIYLNIAKDLEKENDRDTIINIFKYVSDNMMHVTGYGVVDKTPFNDLIRGIAWCDQQGFLFMNLLNKVGINKTRLRDVQAHTYSEVYFDDKWAIVDPFHGFLPLDSENKFLGTSDLEDNTIHDQNGLIKALNFASSSDGIFTGNDYKKTYIPSEGRYINGEGEEFLEFRSYNVLRESIELYNKIAYYIFGKFYFDWVQNTHLKSNKVNNMIDPGDKWVTSYKDYYQKNNKSFGIFYKARNYDIAKRFQKASNLYTDLSEKYPESYWSKEAKLYLAILKYRQMNYIDAEVLFKDLYNDDFLRKNLAGYYLGLISVQNKNYKKASDYFSLSDYYHSKIELSNIQ